MQVESIIEHGTGIINEDCLIMEDNLFGVFDGATSLTSETYENGHTGGFLASNLAGEEFRKNHGTMKELAKRANRVIRQEMAQRNVNLSSKKALWSTSAAVVRIKDNMLEWAQIGDCRIVCIYESGEFEFLCQCPDQDLETLTIWKEVGSETEAPIGEALHEQIAKVRCRMNLDYGVFNGEPEAINFLQTGNHDLTGVRNVLLFTDGLLMPNEKPWEERDYNDHVDLFRQSGLKGLRDHIRSIEATDLGCRTYPRFKTHDDIAAVAINL
ncbi:protein phosphatase 2C domain-containing protein [Maridesulfovibrio sp.]|uniref:protein phosphatase 2C domain-containing protein n=1 Tax=Maridesulfovibrio sp. TaxID=2795000 RepID=UPI003BAC9EE7